MQTENWREFITEDVELVFDLDTPAYNAASSSESITLKITHIKSGREVTQTEKVSKVGYIKLDNGKWLDSFSNKQEDFTESGDKLIREIPFKNRTQFWGRGKQVGGWLGDTNERREVKGLLPLTKEDFIIEEVVSVEPVGFAIHNLKLQIDKIKNYLGIDKAIYLMGFGSCHRHDLLLPHNPKKPDNLLLGQYKGNRTDVRRPENLKAVREYAKKHLKAQEVTGIECDDLINFYGHESHIHYKETGKHKYVLVALDKDQLGNSCLMFNYFRNGDSWNYPYPFLINKDSNAGELSINSKNKVKGSGMLFFCYQLLRGDLNTDNFSPTVYLGKSFGDKACHTYLTSVEYTDEDYEYQLYKAVADKYIEWYYDEEDSKAVKYKAWDGSEVEISWLEWADIIFACAYMLNSYEDDTTFTSELERVGLKEYVGKYL